MVVTAVGFTGMAPMLVGLVFIVFGAVLLAVRRRQAMIQQRENIQSLLGENAEGLKLFSEEPSNAQVATDESFAALSGLSKQQKSETYGHSQTRLESEPQRDSPSETIGPAATMPSSKAGYVWTVSFGAALVVLVLAVAWVTAISEERKPEALLISPQRPPSIAAVEQSPAMPSKTTNPTVASLPTESAAPPANAVLAPPDSTAQAETQRRTEGLAAGATSVPSNKHIFSETEDFEAKLPATRTPIFIANKNAALLRQTGFAQYQRRDAFGVVASPELREAFTELLKGDFDDLRRYIGSSRTQNVYDPKIGELSGSGEFTFGDTKKAGAFAIDKTGRVVVMTIEIGVVAKVYGVDALENIPESLRVFYQKYVGAAIP